MKTLLLCTTLTILFTFHSWSSIALELESESEANTDTNTDKCVPDNDNDTSMCDAPCKQTQSSTRTRTCSNNESVMRKDFKRSKVPASRTWTCGDRDDSCDIWANNGECDKNPVYMYGNCGTSCGVCELSRKYGVEQSVAFKGDPLAVKAVLVRTDKVMGMLYEYYPASIVDQCLNRDSLCSFWSSQGKCQSDFDFMQRVCAPACSFCERLILQVMDRSLFKENDGKEQSKNEYDALTKKIFVEKKTWNPYVIDNATKEKVHPGMAFIFSVLNK